MTRAFAWGAAAAGLGLFALGGVALARNPHCSGGILYVTQAMRDKDKGNIEDYERQIGKAVVELERCVAEDAKDLEALIYLGQAYAEVDSARAAGRTFATAISAFTEKGKGKLLDRARSARDHYWAKAFNEGIARINTAREAYPDFTKKPEHEADETLKGEAAKSYEEAIVSLGRAVSLYPGHAQTMRSLGSVYVFLGDFRRAEEVFQQGLAIAPGDSSLIEALKAARTGIANQLLREKRFDEAVAFYESVTKTSPSDADLMLGLAEARFSLAKALEGDARLPAFRAAGDAYAKASQLRPGDPDLAFNAALAYQHAADWVRAEALWRRSLESRPDDVDAMSGLAGTLAELRKFDEAVAILQRAVAADPKNKSLHRQLGAVYTKAENNAKATQELMVYLALQNGQAVPDAAATAKQARTGSDAARTLAAMGAPVDVMIWEADGEKYESWFYWSKAVAFHFKGGAQVIKSEWGTSASSRANGPGAGPRN